MTSITDTIDRINSAQAGTASVTTRANATSGSGSSLDQASFLRLLTTQLTTQDPFNPVDNTQMIAQMAQFSQVAGIAEMNSSLRTLVSSLGSGNRLSDASGWIGRSALVQSDVATPLQNGSYAGSLTFDAAVDSASVSFVDASGATVHTMDLGARAAGESAFAWDGKDAQGNVVATGPLQIVVNARAAGSPVNPTIAAWTAIAGVQSPASGSDARLVTGLGLITPAQALRLS